MNTFIFIFCAGAVFGAFAMAIMNRWTIEMYRRWYLMVRTELEKLDPKNPALVKIGARTSPVEPWESQ